MATKYSATVKLLADRVTENLRKKIRYQMSPTDFGTHPRKLGVVLEKLCLPIAREISQGVSSFLSLLEPWQYGQRINGTNGMVRSLENGLEPHLFNDRTKPLLIDLGGLWQEDIREQVKRRLYFYSMLALDISAPLEGSRGEQEAWCPYPLLTDIMEVEQLPFRERFSD